MSGRWRGARQRTLKVRSMVAISDKAEDHSKSKNTPFRFWPLNKLIIYTLPWPKGAPTAPEFIVKDEGDLSERTASLRAAVDRFASRGESQTFQPHAAFGPLNAKDWGALVHRHLHHHLTQFGA